MSDSDEDEEPEVIMHSNEELTEFTIVIRRPKRKLSTEEICVELESLAHELDRADGQMKQPGVNIH